VVQQFAGDVCDNVKASQEIISPSNLKFLKPPLSNLKRSYFYFTDLFLVKLYNNDHAQSIGDNVN
jgi:hypothetical protein